MSVVMACGCEQIFFLLVDLLFLYFAVGCPRVGDFSKFLSVVMICLSDCMKDIYRLSNVTNMNLINTPPPKKKKSFNLYTTC